MVLGHFMALARGTGGVFALICCVTPLLPVALGAVGLGGLAATLWSDAVLLPISAGMFTTMGIGLWLARQRKSN